MTHKINLKQFAGSYAVGRLSPQAAIPNWADGQGFVSITRTDEELSVICRADRIPPGITCEREWCCFKFQGPFDFDAHGILLSVIAPLSQNGMGVLAISTYDGDVILVRAANVTAAVTLLQDAGHHVEEML